MIARGKVVLAEQAKCKRINSGANVLVCSTQMDTSKC